MNIFCPRPTATTALAVALLAAGAAPRPARAAEATGQALLVVEQAQGASVERGGARQALAPGSVLVEQDLVRVGPGGHATLRLARHGFTELGPETEVGVERLPFASFAGDLRSVFSLGSGYLRLVWKYPQLSTPWPLYVYLSGQRMGLASGEYFFEARGGQQWACLAAGQVDLTPLGGSAAPAARAPEALRPSACYLLQPGSPPRMVTVAPSGWAAVRRTQGLAGAVEAAGPGLLAAAAGAPGARAGVVGPVPVASVAASANPVSAGVVADAQSFIGPVSPSPLPTGPATPGELPPLARTVPIAPPALQPVPERPNRLGGPPSVPVVAPVVATVRLAVPVPGGVSRPPAAPADPDALPVLYVPPPPPVVAPPGTWAPLQPTTAVVVPAYAVPEESYFSLTSAEAARAGAAEPAATTEPGSLADVPAEVVTGVPVAAPAPPPALAIVPVPAPGPTGVEASRAAPTATPGPGPASWSITYAVTPDPDAARAVQTQLLTRGTPAVVVPVRVGAATQYRVQQRGFASPGEARTALARGHYPGATINKG